MRRILFTGAGGAGTESIYRQWAGRYTLFFGDAAPENISPHIPGDMRVRLPFANTPSFAERMHDIAQALALDLIIPGVDEELAPLAKVEGTDAVQIMVPSIDFVKSMLDKLDSARALKAAGLTVPKTFALEDDFDLKFPIIAKPRSGRGSRGVMKLTEPAQVRSYAMLHGGLERSRFVAQELIEGQEYTVFVCADRDGNLAAIIPIKALMKRGITIRAETEGQPQIIDYVRRLHRHFRPRGLYNVQLMLTKDGGVYPFEINPRISTTFCLAISTGFDPVAAFLAGHTGEAFTPVQQYSLQRSWLNDIAPLPPR